MGSLHYHDFLDRNWNDTKEELEPKINDFFKRNNEYFIHHKFDAANMKEEFFYQMWHWLDENDTKSQRNYHSEWYPQNYAEEIGIEKVYSNTDDLVLDNLQRSYRNKKLRKDLFEKEVREVIDSYKESEIDWLQNLVEKWLDEENMYSTEYLNLIDLAIQRIHETIE